MIGSSAPRPAGAPPATATHDLPGVGPGDEGRLRGALQALGLSAFRPGQHAIIQSVLQGRDTVAIMPTGGGKSLCYQLPGLILPGVAVVVSPLIALMRDQVAALQQRGVAATFINSSISPAEREERQHNLHRFRLVYVAPERFRSPRFCEALARVSLSLVAVDEAHCISEWGHDFRPDYRRLGEVVATLRPPRLLALTATATPEVRRDIVSLLNLTEPNVFVHGFDRKNLDLEVERAGGDKDKLARALRHLTSTRSGVAIIYTSTRKKAVAVAEGLQEAGLSARPYHAGLPDEERHRTEVAFLSGDLPIIVATNAFGMGIDKRDVRLVLHHDLPRSPEAYYQEAGRAGRDGDKARCVLLFNPGDARVQEFLIDQSCPDPGLIRQVYERIEDVGPIMEERLKASLPQQSGLMVDAALRALQQGRAIDDEGEGLRVVGPMAWDQQALLVRQEREHQKLKRMLAYGYGATCRMRFFLDYFGDHFRDDEGEANARTRCDLCDNCRRGQAAPLSDEGHLLVRKALSGVARMDGRFGKRRIAEVLRGDASPEVERARLDQLSTFGLLREHPLPWLIELLGALESAGLCATSNGEYPMLRLLPAGREVMLDRARAAVQLPTAVLAAPKGKAKREPRIRPPLRSTGAARLKAQVAVDDEEDEEDEKAEKAAKAATRAALKRAPAKAARSGGAPPGPGRGARGDGTEDDLPLTPAQEARYERLRALRSELAKATQVPPYVIFHDRTLRAIARANPADEEGLGRVSGIGPQRLQRYAAQVLATLAK